MMELYVLAQDVFGIGPSLRDQPRRLLVAPLPWPLSLALTQPSRGLGGPGSSPGFILGVRAGSGSGSGQGLACKERVSPQGDKVDGDAEWLTILHYKKVTRGLREGNKDVTGGLREGMGGVGLHGRVWEG